MTPIISGSYKSPRFKVGQPLFDILRGDLVVIGVSEAPIAWPLGRSHPVCRPLPIMTVELVRAVRAESELAVMHHFGVSRWTVCRWRRALGVPRFNAGTQQLWRTLAESKLTPEARALAHESLRRGRRAARE